LCCYFLARFDEKARAAIPHVLPLIDRAKTRTWRSTRWVTCVRAKRSRRR
jgi:hypothetical protein